ncbi:MAG: glycine zipper family protein [Stenotrophobium sp.]
MPNSFAVLSAAAVALAVLSVSGCATVPTGPSIAVMPGPYKPFEVFTGDDAICRQYADMQIGVSPAQAQTGEVVGHAAAGAAVGAAAGALIAGSGQGAGVGAGIGLVAGSVAGAGAADRTGYGLQRRYDIAYAQCMYSKGNQVPGYASPAAIPPPPPPR